MGVEWAGNRERPPFTASSHSLAFNMLTYEHFQFSCNPLCLRNVLLLQEPCLESLLLLPSFIALYIAMTLTSNDFTLFYESLSAACEHACGCLVYAVQHAFRLGPFLHFYMKGPVDLG